MIGYGYFVDMNIEARKLHFIESVLSINNEQVLDKLEVLLEQEQKRSLTQRVSIEEYNKEVEAANNRIESGEYLSHEDVRKESETWLR